MAGGSGGPGTDARGALSPQGTPIKFDSSSGQSAIKHNVKSLITGPSKLPRGLPPLEVVPEGAKAVERGKYEDVKAGEPVRSRHTSVVSSGPSVLRSTLHEAPKAQLSPGIYDEASARRTPGSYASPASRGSPMLGRAPDGVCRVCPGLRLSLRLCTPHAGRSPRAHPGARAL